MSLPKWDTKNFGPELEALLGAGDRLPSLSPSRGEAGIQKKIRGLMSKGPFSERTIHSEAEASGIKSGLYLYFDHLEPAHLIAQDIHGPTGAYWHGIMHRREPDDGNSAYWFRRAASHPVLQKLASEAQGILKIPRHKNLAKDLGSGGVWDPFSFIRVCSKARSAGNRDETRVLNELQLMEWRLLFDYCFKKGYG